jgi:hypothetical protein
MRRKTNKFRQTSNLTSHTQRISGTELLGNVRLDGTAIQASGKIIFSRKNAANPIGTRLERLAPLYKRWRVHKYTYRFIPAQPTTLAGSLVLAQDPDPLAVYLDNVGNVNRLMTLEGAEMRQVWEKSESRLSPSGDYTTLWTTDLAPTVDDPSDRLSYAGQFIIAIASSGALGANMDLGFVELDYDVEFYSPNLSSQSTDDFVPWTDYLFSAWQAYTSTRENDTFNSYFADLLTSTYSAAETVGTLFKVLRDTKIWTAPSPLYKTIKDYKDPSPKIPYFSEIEGLPRGLYTFQFFIGSLLTTTASSIVFSADNHPSTGDITGFWIYGHGATERKSALVSPGVMGPDGIHYPWSVSWSGQFNITAERGYVALYIENGATPVHADTRIFSRLSAHDTGLLFEGGAPGSALRKRAVLPSRVPYQYGSDERKENFLSSLSLATPKLVRTGASDLGYEVVGSTDPPMIRSSPPTEMSNLRRR